MHNTIVSTNNMVFVLTSGDEHIALTSLKPTHCLYFKSSSLPSGAALLYSLFWNLYRSVFSQGFYVISIIADWSRQLWRIKVAVGTKGQRNMCSKTSSKGTYVWIRLYTVGYIIRKKVAILGSFAICLKG